ncbi:bactofilin family protein [Amaricoccus macauensis]|uniref:bactofilin family protein n=1 Tax=Amaricoccus macauensis TaxID=57001 RepID=UPI003C7D33A6
MFSKTRTTESGPQFNDIPETTTPPKPSETATSAAPPIPSPAPKKAKPAASVLSSDITITGNVRSSGDIQIEGNIEGDVRAQTLIVGETATVKGEVIADEVITHGRVIGRLRGLKIRLSSSARVEGDIIHKAIAIESGAQFEGSVQRHEDPVGGANNSSSQRSQSSNLSSVPSPAPAKAVG